MQQVFEALVSQYEDQLKAMLLKSYPCQSF